MYSNLTQMFLFPLLIGMTLSLTACLDPPGKPKKGYARGQEDNANGTKLPEVETGGEIKEGKGSTGYNLACAKDETRRGIRAWRRLSNAELINTAKDIFGVTDAVDFSSLNSDIPKEGLFDTVQSPETFMDLNRLKGYETFAHSVVKAVNINALFPCMASGESCINQKISELGSLAWRRPFTEDDSKLFVTLYKNLTLDGAPSAATLPYLLEALILSPNFMYRSELGVMNNDKEFELTPWEMASALSYMIWRRPPDAELRTLAQNDMLKTPEALKAQAKRLFASPNAKAAMQDFGDMWFDGKNIVGVIKAEPKFTMAVKADMQNEVRDFVATLMLDADKGTYNELLTANWTPASASSSFVNGAMPDAQQMITYKEKQRRGLLGQAGFLASHAYSNTPNPITRGVFVTKRLLCAEFAVVQNMDVPPQKPGLSNKERFQVHSEHPACAACHKMIDPFGFAMETFDSNGIFRAMDGDKPIVIDSKFMLDGKEVSVTTPEDLGKALAGSRQGMECYSRQAFRYAFGRVEFVPRLKLGGDAPVDNSVQRQLDQCELDTVSDEMQKNGGKLQNALISMISSPAFRLRLKSEMPQVTRAYRFTGSSH